MQIKLSQDESSLVLNSKASDGNAFLFLGGEVTAMLTVVVGNLYIGINVKGGRQVSRIYFLENRRQRGDANPAG